MKNIKVKTGQIVERSAQYLASGTKKEITLVKDEVVPPNPYGGKPIFTLVDKTKHKSK